jgi:threonine aldolase
MYLGEVFHSVYVSFYKGLDSIAGAMLAGSSDFIEIIY